MAEDAKQVFLDTVLACAPEHFQAADILLLRRYSEAHARATRAASAMAEADTIVNDEATKVFLAMSKLASTLALRLRLSPQARTPRMPKLQPLPTSIYDRMRLERESGR
jgi:hypothetical protein